MRYLLLVLLCIIALPGAALAADSWAAGAVDVPDSMVWGGTNGASVDVTNDGTTAWDATFTLDSVLGPTLTATAINRWGVQQAPVTSPVAAGGDYTFDFDVTAPPITTLKYNLPVTPTSVPVASTLESNWQMANAGTLITTSLATGATSVHRFSDVGDPALDYAHNWCLGEAEVCAGQVPAITTGYPDGKFQPIWAVTRDQMAVFMARALKLGLEPYAGTFTDIPETNWAALQIEALVNAGVVTGYPDGTFRPLPSVDRATMAVFVARGLAGGEDKVITPAETIEFSDENVDTPFADGGWAYKHVQYCVANNVVTGYPDNTYRPKVVVNRGTMIVFMYRAFVRPTDATVVLAGPAITHVNPAAAAYNGWSSTSVVRPGNMGSAYVGFDALRFQPATTPTPDVTVEFKLYDAADIGADGLPIGAAVPAVQSGALLVNKAAAQAAALVDGVPYAYQSWAIPDQAAGDYKLLTYVDGTLLAREPSLQVDAGATSGLLVAGLNTDAVADETWDMVSGRNITAGTEADLAAADGVYVETMRARQPYWDDPDGGDWCNDGNYGNALIWEGIPTDATSLTLTLKYYANNPNDGTWGGPPPGDPDCCATSCCGDWGALDDWTDPAGHTPAYTSANDPENSPLGWGLTVMTGPGGGDNWWDQTDGVLDGSGDPMLPASTDVHGGGDMFPGEQGFIGFSRTDTTQVWGTNYPAQYLNGDGAFVVVFCGGSIYKLEIDQAVLQYTLP